MSLAVTCTRWPASVERWFTCSRTRFRASPAASWTFSCAWPATSWAFSRVPASAPPDESISTPFVAHIRYRIQSLVPRVRTNKRGYPRQPNAVPQPDWAGSTIHPVGMRATTVRFGEDLWSMLERESRRLGISAAQFVRESTIMRLSMLAGSRGGLANADAALGQARTAAGSALVGGQQSVAFDEVDFHDRQT